MTKIQRRQSAFYGFQQSRSNNFSPLIWSWNVWRETLRRRFSRPRKCGIFKSHIFFALVGMSLWWLVWEWLQQFCFPQDSSRTDSYPLLMNNEPLPKKQICGRRKWSLAEHILNLDSDDSSWLLAHARQYQSVARQWPVNITITHPPLYFRHSRHPARKFPVAPQWQCWMHNIFDGSDSELMSPGVNLCGQNWRSVILHPEKCHLGQFTDDEPVLWLTIPAASSKRSGRCICKLY